MPARLVPDGLECADGLDTSPSSSSVSSAALFYSSNVVFTAYSLQAGRREPLARKSCGEGSNGIRAVVLYKSFRIIK